MMKKDKILRLRELLILILFAMLIMQCLASCVSIKLPDIEIQPVYQYQFFKEKEGLKISVDPIFDEDRVKKFFGIDLLSEGILPILVVVENHNTKCSFFLKKDSSLIETTNGEFITIPKTPDPSTSKNTQQGAIIASIFFPIVIPFSAKAYTDYEIIMQNLIKKELIEKAIPPGKSQHGFLYFKLQNKTAIIDVSAVHIKALNFSSGEVIVFIFHLKTKRGN